VSGSRFTRQQLAAFYARRRGSHLSQMADTSLRKIAAATHNLSSELFLKQGLPAEHCSAVSQRIEKETKPPSRCNRSKSTSVLLPLALRGPAQLPGSSAPMRRTLGNAPRSYQRNCNPDKDKQTTRECAALCRVAWIHPVTFQQGKSVRGIDPPNRSCSLM
jgi:hypothetical protein